ncbi:MAG: lipoteichoic acid synthase [Pseudothermotoga sp.]|nr:lipoteichoic acid synthase [Pseudothermotoga sp.]
MTKQSRYTLLLYVLINVKLFLFYLFTVGITRTQSYIMSFLWCSMLWVIFSTFIEKKQFVLYSILSGMFIVDYLYFQNFGTLPSIKQLLLLPQLPKVGSSIKYFLNPVSLSFVGDIPFLILLDRKFLKSLSEREKPSQKIVVLLVTLCLAFAFFPAFLQNLKPMQFFNRYGLVAYHAYDPVYLLVFEKRASSTPPGPTQSRSESGEKSFSAIAKDRNVIVVQFESLQNVFLRRTYGNQAITPNLNTLLEKDSIYFSNYFQQTGTGNTADAEFISLTSLHVPGDHPAYETYSDTELDGLVRVLKRAGYYTVAFHGNTESFWNRARAYACLGFDDFVSLEDLDQDEIVGMGLSDFSLYRQTVEILKRLPQPFFAFVVTLSSHTPFILPQELKTLTLEPRHVDTLFGNYLQAINYADRAFGYFLQLLKESGLYEKSIIVVYGDHAGLYPFHKETKTLVSEWLNEEYDFLKALNVPLIVHVPGLGKSYEVKNVGGQVDFTPTILNMLGLNCDLELYVGKDLCNDGSFVAFRHHLPDGSFFDGERLFVVSEEGTIRRSVGIDVKRNEPMPYYEFLDGYQRAIKQIEVSRHFLERLKSKGSGNLETR